MKQFIYLFAAVLSFTACKDESKPAATAETKSDAVAMPYTASYSSSFTISDNQKNAQSVLQSYKDWEDNKLNNAPAYFADTVTMNFWDGSKYTMGRDSMVKTFQKYRDSLSSSKIVVDAVVNLHSTDKNADWVCVWYKQTDTYKTGKVDSAYYQDDNNLVNGKIVLVSSKKQFLKK